MMSFELLDVGDEKLSKWREMKNESIRFVCEFDTIYLNVPS